MGDIELYLANEFGFEDEHRKDLYEKIVPKLEKMGYTVLEPFRENCKNYDWQHINSLKTCKKYNQALRAADLKTGKNNVLLMDRSKVMAAILDGSHAGCIGVGAEIGYFFSKKQPIIAIRTDFRLAENPTARIDIQVEHFITHTPGGKLLFNYEEWYVELEELHDSLKR